MGKSGPEFQSEGNPAHSVGGQIYVPAAKEAGALVYLLGAGAHSRIGRSPGSERFGQEGFAENGFMLEEKDAVAPEFNVFLGFRNFYAETFARFLFRAVDNVDRKSFPVAQQDEPEAGGIGGNQIQFAREPE